MLEFESPRLRLREVTEADLADLLPAYLTNPQFLTWSNTPGYDIAALHRDWEEVQQTAIRFLLGIYRKDTDEAIGIADFLEQNPADGFPWLGLLLIHGSHQGQGLGREAYDRLAEHVQTDRGWPVLRLGVLRANRPAFAFWRWLGFRPVSRDIGSEAICLERHLAEPLAVPVRRHKVMAYITHGECLLVFTHPGASEAGVQVPAGTVEEGEDPAEAVLREAREETGLTGLKLVSFLGERERDMVDVGRDEIHHRHFYHVRYAGDVPPT